MTKMRRKSSANDKKNSWQFRKESIKLNTDALTATNRLRREQECRKCFNHEITVSMRNHKDCPRKNCVCDKCHETDKRRDAVKKEAKDKRQRIKGTHNDDSSVSSRDASSPDSTSSNMSEESMTNDYGYYEVKQEEMSFDLFPEFEIKSEYYEMDTEFVTMDYPAELSSPTNYTFSETDYQSVVKDLIDEQFNIDQATDDYLIFNSFSYFQNL